MAGPFISLNVSKRKTSVPDIPFDFALLNQLDQLGILKSRHVMFRQQKGLHTFANNLSQNWGSQLGELFIYLF